MLRSAARLLDDPEKTAIFTTDQKKLVPDPAIYAQWFERADPGLRRLAVGAGRYNAVEQQLGAAPRWQHFLDPDTGDLVELARLKEERPIARARRVARVDSVIDERHKLTRETATFGFVRPDKDLPRVEAPPAATIKAAEHFAAHALGVDASFRRRLGIANQVNAGLASLRNLGFKLPARVAVASQAYFRQVLGDAEGVPAAFEPGQDRVIIQPIGMWQEMGATAVQARHESWWSTDSDKHAIWHETGHALHHAADPAFWRKLYGAPPPAALEPIISREVSRYAATNLLEFVAETFAALVHGKTFAPEIMQFYRRLKGPMP